MYKMAKCQRTFFASCLALLNAFRFERVVCIHCFHSMSFECVEGLEIVIKKKFLKIMSLSNDVLFGLKATFYTALCTICWQERSFTGSYLQGLLDELVVIYTNLRGQYAFDKGLGCYKRFHDALNTMTTMTPEEMLPKQVHLHRWKKREKSLTCKGWFKSPIRRNLPDEPEVATVHFEIVCPVNVDFETVIRESKSILCLAHRNSTHPLLLFQIDQS